MKGIHEATDKNPFQAGKAPNDARGAVRRFTVHLLPEQMDQLDDIANANGYKNVSRLIAAWADTTCKGAPQNGTTKRRRLRDLIS